MEDKRNDCPGACPVRGSSGAFAVRMADRVRRFGRCEDGSSLFLALVILMIMLLTGGMAIDLMRYEAERTRIQGTAASAVPAVASLRQDRPARDVVEDRFERTGPSEALVEIDVNQALTRYSVRVERSTVTRPYFLHMLNVGELRPIGTGTAEQSRANIEVSLVLDVSASIRSGSRTVHRRASAAEFVTQLPEDDPDNRISVSIVPCSGHVILGRALLTRHTLTHRHDLTHGIDLPNSAQGTLALSPSTPCPQTGHADGVLTTSTNDTWTLIGGPASPAGTLCKDIAANAVVPLTNNRMDRVNRIEGLVADGQTTIDLGLRLGAALPDPGSRSVVSDLAAAVMDPAHFDGRPLAHGDGSTV